MTLLIIGLVVLAIAAACLYGARHERSKVDQLQATETYACSDIGDALAGRLCEVAGAAQPGPGGLITAPQSGDDGVWFAHKVTRHWWEVEPDDGDSDHRAERRKRERVVSEQRSEQPFAVDDGSGRVLIHHGGHKLERAPGVRKVSARGGPPEGYKKGVVGFVEQLDDRREWFEYEEWLLPAGTQLFVSGEVGLHGDALAIGKPSNGGQLVISTKSEEELLKSSGRNAKILQVIAIAAAVAAAALVVAGLLTL
jgi:hypothetical protein